MLEVGWFSVIHEARGTLNFTTFPLELRHFIALNAWRTTFYLLASWSHLSLRLYRQEPDLTAFSTLEIGFKLIHRNSTSNSQINLIKYRYLGFLDSL